jgi:hypothetical protein
MSRPTSLRLTPAQEAELAALAEALPARRPDLAAGLPGGAATPGGVLRLALAHGLRALRAELEEAAADPGADPGRADEEAAAAELPTPAPAQPVGVAEALAAMRADLVADVRAALAELRLDPGAPPAPTAAPGPAPRPETPPGWRLAVHGEGRAEVLIWRHAGRVGVAWPAGRWSCADLPARAAPVPARLAIERCPEPELVAAAAVAAWPALGRPTPPADAPGAAPVLALVRPLGPPPAPAPYDPPEALVLRANPGARNEVDLRVWREPEREGQPLRLGLAWPRLGWVRAVGPIPCRPPSADWLFTAGLVKADAVAVADVLASAWDDLIAWAPSP